MDGAPARAAQPVGVASSGWARPCCLMA